MENMIGTSQAAQILGISERRIRALIEDGKIEAQKVSDVWVIPISALSEVKTYGKPGRPKRTRERILEES